MIFTKDFTTFCKEAFTLHVFLAETAVKTLGVVVVVKSFNPSISGFYGESTRYTLGGKQFVPVFFTIRKSVLQIEWGVGKYFPTVGTDEALRVEVGAHGFQAVPNDLLATLAAFRGEVPAVAVLAVQLPLLLYKANVLQ